MPVPNNRSPFRYPWEVPPEEQTLLELAEEMEVALCAHSQPTVPTDVIESWMELLKRRLKKNQP